MVLDIVQNEKKNLNHTYRSVYWLLHVSASNKMDERYQKSKHAIILHAFSAHTHA